MDILDIVEELRLAKMAEDDAKAKRVAIEDRLARAIQVPDSWTGSMANPVGRYKVTVRRTMNTRIDMEKLNEMACDSAFPQEAKKLLQWKPELNAKAWKAAPQEWRTALSPAITMTPGKVSFKIEEKGE